MKKHLLTIDKISMFSFLLPKEKTSKKESENRILKHVDEKIYGIKVEGGRNKRIREEFEEKNN